MIKIMEEKNQLIKEIKEALDLIYRKGTTVQELLRRKYNYLTYLTKSEYRYINGLLLPQKYEEAKILTTPEMFFLLLIEKFWNLFRIINENIEDALIQPWVRVIFEHTCDIFWYLNQSTSKKKYIACKFWLCTLGLLKGKLNNLSYEDFLNFLDEKEKLEFLELQKRGFPEDEFHKKLHTLFPSISKENLPTFIEDYFKSLKDISLNKEQLENFYKWLSLYHHPNILVIINLEKELENKSHIFRCFALMACCGVNLINFLGSEILKNSDLIFTHDEKEKIAQLTKKAYEIFRN
jgi:hypothetical protein